MTGWRPGATPETLAARAALLASVRRFFAERGVLEVDTPVLARTTVTEPAIESVAAGPRWLQTSPEYFMKRLLAAGSGPIYQIARCFRAGEHGRLHNPEFLMLEWYRPGMDDHALMSEVDALLGGLLPGFPARRRSFRDLVEAHFGVDPLTAEAAGLAAAVAGDWRQRGRDGDPLALTAGDRGELLDLAYSEAVEACSGALLVTDFPPEQAALARLREDGRGDRVAARFELVVDGVELANGFHELADAAEQRRRFEADRARRRAAGQEVPDADEHLLAALAAGLPDCSGVALGLDRVLLLQLGLDHLDQAMPFSDPRC
jgi:lysyl-tRNA synthetase class 2